MPSPLLYSTHEMSTLVRNLTSEMNDLIRSFLTVEDKSPWPEIQATAIAIHGLLKELDKIQSQSDQFLATLCLVQDDLDCVKGDLREWLDAAKAIGLKVGVDRFDDRDAEGWRIDVCDKLSDPA